VQIVEASSRQLERWDERVGQSLNGTIFHRRSFLTYHGDRFAKAERYLLALDGTSVRAQIALTIHDGGNERMALSPYGGSYGSFVLMEQPTYSMARDLVVSFNDYLREQRIDRFVTTPPIACCAVNPLDVLYFAMLTHGYRSVSRDLSSIVKFMTDRQVSDQVSSRARNMARKAQARNITVKRGNLADFWRVLQQTFERHGTRPTHSLSDLEYLSDKHPGQIYFDVAYDDKGEPLAGVGYFVINSRVNSSFYLCQNPVRAEDQALSLLILYALEDSQNAGFSFFDFGTSTIGMVPRDNILRFKESFSKLATFRETFEWAAA